MLKTGVTIKCELIRSGMIELLKKLNNIFLTFQCNNIAETRKLSKKYETEMLILDYQLLYPAHIKIINQLKEEKPERRLFIYLDHSPDHSYTEIKDKVDAYLHKGISYHKFKKIISRINHGEEDYYIEDSDFINDCFKDTDEKSFQSDLVYLTKREKEILQCMAEGMENKKIAENLYISERTVKNINYTIYKKLSVKNRTHAVVKALNEGLVSIS